MSKILISYRCEDSADVTVRIYDQLIHQFGQEAVFKDVDSIPLVSIFALFWTHKWPNARCSSR